LLSTVPRPILTRIGLLLLALVASFAAALAGLHTIEQRGIREIVADEVAEHGRLLDALLAQAARPLRLFTESYARRISFTRPADPTRGASAESTLRAGLRTFDLHAAWVVEADGTVRLHEKSASEPALEAPPLTPAQLASLTTATTTFYLERAGVVYRVRGARLAADSTHRDARRGWLFAALRWDVQDLSPPNLPIEGRLTLLPPDQAGQPATGTEPVRIERLLRDFSNQPIRVLRQDYRPSEIDEATSTDWLELLVLAAFGLITIGILAFCLVRWVILPAGTLRRSLLHRDQQALDILLARGGYIGELALLIRQSLETQHRLEQTLEDRARLGRELHDGVIQTIYAAGMGLAGARATLRENPAAAERVLDDTKTELNATILDLRSFIKGLESDESSRRKFSEAVHSLTGLMQFSRAVRFVIEIDDLVADRFPADERMQLLQIVREAASNAVRHSGATLVTIRLHTVPPDVVLEIDDNGSGFDTAASVETGHGLANFQARARELGGTITITSCPKGGTRVKLLLPRQF